MSVSDLRTELVARLDQLVPFEDVPARWDDVLDRTRIVRRRSARFRLAIGVAAVFLLSAGAATALYELLHRESSRQPTPGALTITAGGYNAKWPVEIIEVAPGVRRRVLWRCPTGVVCGEPKGIAWSPDGRRVAFTLAAFNLSSSYLGLHILDVRTGHDVHPATTGCQPASVAWSPDARTLAYDCAAWAKTTSRIHLINANGTHDRLLAVAGTGATSPTWSPGGRSLAFSRRGAIYVARIDSRSVRIIARSGAAPDWSPSGRAIAFRGPSGIRLITTNGKPIRSATGRLDFGPPGVPAWSPDGGRLAISGGGLYIVDADGRHLSQVSISKTVGSLGPQPSWYPAGQASKSVTAPRCRAC
jgi:dipeptidyl aminopeptidase/acylaminoacyl peptidase